MAFIKNNYEVIDIDGEKCVKIFLTRGYHTIIDYADLELVGEYKWHAKVANHTVYAGSHLPRVKNHNPSIRMHRLLLGLVPYSGLFVDHIDRNGLNNRRSNLRLATPSQNCNNRSRVSSSCNKFIGVSNGTHTFSFNVGAGGFKSEELAATARDRTALLFHDPDFVQLNFEYTNEEKIEHLLKIREFVDYRIQQYKDMES